jgi:hypothetical protein
MFPEDVSESAPDASSGAPVSTQAFDRLMFRLLLPGLLLPCVLTLTATLIASQPATGPAGNSTDRSIFSLVIGVFLFVQLGSQVLSGWILLRRPASFYNRTLRRYTGVLYAISYGLQLAWLAVIFVDLASPLGLAFGPALAIVSTMIGFTLVAEKALWHAGESAPVSAAPLAIAPRIILVGYLAVSAIAFALWLTARLLPVPVSDGSSFNGLGIAYTLAAISLILIVLLGLPWSHTLLGIAIVTFVAAFAGIQLDTGGVELWLDAVLLLPVLANATFVIILLRSERRRVRLVNWFFRLTGTTDIPAPSHEEGVA